MLIPENHAAKYYFEYGTAEADENRTSVGSLTASFAFDPVEAKLSGLSPNTVYRYRLVAEDSEHHVVEGPEETFETLPPARIDGLSVGNVSAESADLQAQVNPLGTDTKVFFEYAPLGSSEYKPTPEQDIGAGVEDVAVSVPVQGLAAGTVYSYRVVASNALGEAPRVQPSQFSTQPAGAPFALLDGRSWEQVSPPRKGVANIKRAAEKFVAPLQSSPDGEALTYGATGSSEGEPEGEPLFGVDPLAAWCGWLVFAGSRTPNEYKLEKLIGEKGEYRLFSERSRTFDRGTVAVYAAVAMDERTHPVPARRGKVRGIVDARLGMLPAARNEQGTVHGRRGKREVRWGTVGA